MSNQAFNPFSVTTSAGTTEPSNQTFSPFTFAANSETNPTQSFNFESTFSFSPNEPFKSSLDIENNSNETTNFLDQFTTTQTAQTNEEPNLIFKFNKSSITDDDTVYLDLTSKMKQDIDFANQKKLSSLSESVTEELLLSYIPDALSDNAICDKLFRCLVLYPQHTPTCMHIIEEKIKQEENVNLTAALTCLTFAKTDYSHLIPKLLSCQLQNAITIQTLSKVCLHHLRVDFSSSFDEYAAPIITEYINSDDKQKRQVAVQYVAWIEKVQLYGVFSILENSQESPYRSEIVDSLLSDFGGLVFNTPYQKRFILEFIPLVVQSESLSQQFCTIIAKFNVDVSDRITDLTPVIICAKDIKLMISFLNASVDNMTLYLFAQAIQPTVAELLYATDVSNRTLELVCMIMSRVPMMFKKDANHLFKLVYPRLNPQSSTLSKTEASLFTLLGILLSTFSIDTTGSDIINKLVIWITTRHSHEEDSKALTAIVNSPYCYLLGNEHITTLTNCSKNYRSELLNSLIYVFPSFYYPRVDTMIKSLTLRHSSDLSLLIPACFVFRAGNILMEKHWPTIFQIVGKIAKQLIINKTDKDRITRCLCYLFEGFITTEQLVYYVKKNYSYNSVTSALRDVGKALMKRGNNTDISMIIQIALQMGRSPDIQVLMFNELKNGLFTDVTIKRTS
jgi:hypothetical protein